MSSTASRRFEFVSQACDRQTFEVVAMEGYEAISRPFRFTLTLASADLKVDFDSMLEKPATFTLWSADGAQRSPYHGVLAEFDQLHHADGKAFYRAVLVPRLWRLSQYHASQAFTVEQPIGKILETVLKSGNLCADDFQMKLDADADTYRKRSFVCQHQESHLDFLSRWMEKEGMYYHFDHADGRDTLVIIDDKIRQDGDVEKVYYHPVDALENSDSNNSVQAFVCRQKPLPRRVVLHQFNHRKADLPLKVEARVSEQGIGEVSLYDENYRDSKEGERYAKIRAEEILCNGRVFSGESTATVMRSGHFVQMINHYRSDFNTKYLVTEIHHEGTQTQVLGSGAGSAMAGPATQSEITYRNSFRAIPAGEDNNVQFRADRITPTPRISGTLSAEIDSDGDEAVADLDAYGQYRVKLPFGTEREGSASSTRIRMASPYTGDDYGMHLPLHKGAGVLLSFVNGDPDQPVIANAVPNSEKPSVVNSTNPLVSLFRTAGGNEIALDDKSGDENVLLTTPALRGTVSIGGKSGNVFYSGSSSSSIATLSSSSYCGILGDTAVSLGGRANFCNLTDFTSSASKIFRHARGGVTTWTGSEASLSDKQTFITKQAKTLASESIHLSAGIDEDVIAGQAVKAAAIDTFADRTKAYLYFLHVSKSIPGLAVTTRAGAQGATLVPVLDKMKTRDRFDLPLYRKLKYAQLPSTLGSTVVGQLFGSIFGRHEALQRASNMYLTKDGVNYQYEYGKDYKGTMVLSKQGFKLTSKTDNYGSKGTTAQTVQSCSESGVLLSSEVKKAGAATCEYASMRLEGGMAFLRARTWLSLTSHKNVELRGGKGSAVELSDNKAQVLAENVNIGFTLPNPTFNDLNAKLEAALAKQVLLESEIDLRKAQMRPVDITGVMTRAQRAELEESLRPAIEKNAALTAENLVAQTELSALAVEISATRSALAAQVPPDMVHGVTISSSAVQMTMGSAGVKATKTQLALSLGTTGVNFSAGGLSLTDDKLIKIG